MIYIKSGQHEHRESAVNINSYFLYEKTGAKKSNLDHKDDAKMGQRSHIIGAKRFAYNERATTSNDTDNIHGGKAIDTSATGLSHTIDCHVGKRLLRVSILLICYSVLELMVKAVTVVQFIFVAWKKRPHPGMQRLGTMIAEYMRTLWRYCTFASDDSPWPFRR